MSSRHSTSGRSTASVASRRLGRESIFSEHMASSAAYTTGGAQDSSGGDEGECAATVAAVRNAAEASSTWRGLQRSIVV